MNDKLTDLTVVLDRSGSMASCKSDAEGGLNEFIRKQKELPGECLFSLVQFDTEYECVHRAIQIQDVPHCSLEPRGSTALLDAVGKSINETGKRLKTMEESQRPGLVAFVIVSDGQENSSRKFTKTKIKKMIDHQTNVYKWQFTYLGANQDAFAEAGGMGIDPANAADYGRFRTSEAFSAASGNVGRMRSSAASGQTVRNRYTDEEREEMK